MADYMSDELESMCGFGGDCGEPSYRTSKGYPICECGRSTRNKNSLVCRDCRDGWILSADDRTFLRAVGIKNSRHRSDRGMLIEEIVEAATQTVKQMSPEEKAKLRQQLDKGRFK